MLDFDDIIANISDFSLKDFARRKPLVLCAICIIIFLFVSGLIILMIQTAPEKNVVYDEIEHFEADAPVLIPDAPQIEKDYFPSRTTENQWSENEIHRWFTYPDETIMSDLEKNNDKTVKDILGAAP